MIELIKNIVLYDINCLNNLLNYDDTLFTNKNIKLIISQQLYDKLKNTNCALCDRINRMKEDKLVQIYDIAILSEEHATYKLLKKGTDNICHGKCESAAISIAIHNNGFILTDSKHNIIDKMGSYKLKWITLNDLIN